MTAYLISTRHGEYLVDTPDGTDVLSAEVSGGASELLEDLGRANAGNPYASIYGVFEGRLVTDERGKPIKLLINSQVH
ncbi:hypothetical protein LYSHEL_27120 [Lysobacter helvus]|uniref:Fumarylacetoacetate hydrolase n=3 Tax=Lysobacterales TaxID=135614 RepID=A0ABM7Q8E7_9GAMM|nr:hypothetical protein LYSCAS_27090 [Lysobacter caseinilyticus]BCT96841.1 hypothetical protein LYSHEL_27120 [Lysobacter helvus]